MPSLPNYVKFQRGTSNAYDKLRVKDQNTLYFILDTADQDHGKLYLGDRLISSNVGSGGTINLSDLEDILITESHAGDFLVLNSEGKWINQSAADVANIILNSKDFISDIDTNEFNLNAVSKQLELKGFNEAAAGMMPVKSNSGTLNWQTPPPDLTNKVNDLETLLNQLDENLQAVDKKILDSNHLKYQIINNLDDATEDNVIYLYQKEVGNLNDYYDEYLFINNNLEKIGNTSLQLDNYVTVSDFNTTIGNLENEFDKYVLNTKFQAVVGDLSVLNQYNNLSNDASLADIAEDIYERLIWQEIQE